MNFTIEVPIYNRDVMVSIAESDVDLEKVLRRKAHWTDADIEDAKLGEGVNGTVVSPPKSGILLRLRAFPKSAADYGVVAHEIRHAVDIIMERAGVRFSMEYSDEAYAYLTGYLTTEIYSRAGFAGCDTIYGTP